MIRDIEVRNRARRLGVDAGLIRKDHVLNHVLAGIAADPGDLVFRGGTALSRAHWPDFRISEDLDFVTEGKLMQGSELVTRAVGKAAQGTGHDLRVEFDNPDSSWMRAIIRWDEALVSVDLNRAERPRLPTDLCDLDLPYSDLADEPSQIDVVALEEILADKLYMLDDRQEPRDLFDLWYGTCVKGVPFDEIAAVFKTKYGGTPSLWRVDRALKAERAWGERLAHQMRDLPPFTRVLKELRTKVQKWEES
jgi:predicted nucleotidyltransferase component of viral defense system